MAGTEHRLAPQHVDRCLALSSAANWNQTAADWRLMLERGRGWGVSLDDGTLAASTLVLPYGDFAWVSMVLVLPEQRRKGHATRLLRTALADLEARGLTPVLDATPAGREVYRRQGFETRWEFTRLELRQAFHTVDAQADVRALLESDWSWILELDAAAFGASRAPLLRALAARLPAAALVVPAEGFLLGRDGRQATQLGPLVARNEAAARALLVRALQRVAPPVFLDVAAEGLRAWLLAGGFREQRPFARMVKGAAPAPGRRELALVVAGPELG